MQPNGLTMPGQETCVSSVVRNSKLSPNLDILRAIAVACVVASHLAGAYDFRQVGSLGRFGVILFFIHTSFVLMASLQRMSKEATGWRLASAFWIRRIFRIYPLSVFFVLLVWIFHVPAGPGLSYVSVGTKGLLSNLALTQNLTYSNDVLGPLWSLPLEVQMYALLPFAYFLLKGGRSRSLALWALTVPIALLMPHITGRLSVFTYAPCFGSGIVAFDLLAEKRGRKLPSWIWPVGIGIAIALFRPFDNISLDHKIYRAWVLSLFVALLFVHTGEATPSRFHRIPHWVAEHSYGIYLSHIVLIWFALYMLPRHALAVPFLVITLPAAPVLLYRFVEHPLTVLGARYSRLLLRAELSSPAIRDVTVSAQIIPVDELA